ncbi:hypothetical protein OH809_35650 [Streptomyces sp. NBC_00873]|nr:hypothetical protein OH809_35650 [Streptomyces sp. NBC_00873]WTA42566.1 hypothetical protein OH821_08060 [Streptomyces sp. NBC_00842]
MAEVTCVLEDCDGETGFLVQFPDEGVNDGLIPLKPVARDLPRTAEVVVGFTSHEEGTDVVHDDARGDEVADSVRAGLVLQIDGKPAQRRVSGGGAWADRPCPGGR